MRTLAARATSDHLKTRLSALQAHDAARWGRMNAYQMLRHLTDAILVPLGEKQVSERSRLFERTLMKWGGLWVPTHWPQNVPTPPEIDMCQLGVYHGDFEAARQDTLHQLARLHTTSVGGARHPFFGPLSQKEWMRWGWLHTDHHLRQFGR
jgi:hypothetical protein